MNAITNINDAAPLGLDAHATAIFDELMQRQIRAIHIHGHTAQRDDQIGLYGLGRKAQAFVQIAADRAEGPKQRRLLNAARTKALQSIIIIIGFIAAIDREIAREKASQI